ncbi:MAG: PDZ domain-containing protein, partial [Kiritimatiellae bacterium]|nr:PDZ domain-containing protein [Kiritimatiellia bacterium]
MVEILVRRTLRPEVFLFFLYLAAMSMLCGCSSVPKADKSSEAITGACDSYDEMAVLAEAILLTKRFYVQETDFRDLVYGAVDGMLSGLDPNCAFLPPSSLAELEEEARGSFGGIGVSIGMGKGSSGVKVIAPIEDSPAFKAGIHAGDVITAVDGRDTTGASVEEISSAIKGDTGSSVKLTVERDNGETLDFALVREEIKISSVKGPRVLDDGIGYVLITTFNAAVAEDFAAALARLEREVASGL